MINLAYRSICAIACVVALTPLVLILSKLMIEGAGVVSLDLVTQNPPGPLAGTGGGILPSIAGTFSMLLLGLLVAAPIGVWGGLFLSEKGHTKVGKFLRLTHDLVSSTPSIVVGMTIYGVVVVPMKQFSMIAGAMALAMIMIPMITRGTEEICKMVPLALREAGMGLGMKANTLVFKVVLQTAKPSIIGIVLLAFARAAGEAAPLLFTAFNDQIVNLNPLNPTSSIPVQLYTMAISPFQHWHALAWGSALVLVAMVIILNLIVKLIGKNRHV